MNDSSRHPSDVVINLVVGPPPEGIEPDWCDVCLTPAVYHYPLTFLDEDGVSDGGYARWCHRCYVDAEDSGGR